METALKIRNILFKIFIINYILLVLAWLFSFTGIFENLMMYFFEFDIQMEELYMADMLGIWKIINVVFFLIPAIAIHWEYRWNKPTKKKR